MKEKIKVLYANKSLRYGLYIVGGLLVVGIIFQVGLFMGYHKASFGRDFGNHYERNFGMNRDDSFGGMMSGKFPTAHGAYGEVLTVALPNFVIEDREGVEKNIVISDKTLIKNGLENASSSSIKVDDEVIVLGEPNEQGQIEAKLIRIMPEGFASSTNRYNMMFRK